MKRQDAAGLDALVRILGRLVERQPLTLAEIVASEDMVRSTAFAVARRMERGGLVVRTPTGRLTLGPTAGALGYSAYGVGPIYGAVQALLPWLRDETDATVALDATDGATYVNLATWPASWHREPASEPAWTCVVPIRNPAGREVARLKALCAEGSDERRQSETRQLAEAVALRLSEGLADRHPPESEDQAD